MTFRTAVAQPRMKRSSVKAEPRMMSNSSKMATTSCSNRGVTVLRLASG